MPPARGTERPSAPPHESQSQPAHAHDTVAPSAEVLASAANEAHEASSAMATIAPAAASSLPPAASAPAPVTATPSERPQPITSLPGSLEGTARSVPAPNDREALLSRLRQRAASLTDEQKAAVWGHRGERSS